MALRKTEAEALAAILVKKLGIGWQSEVWDNVGWTYCAFNGPVTVYPNNRRTKFYCMIAAGVDERRYGAGIWNAPKYFENPRKAVEHATKVARDVVNGLLQAVEFAERSLHPERCRVRRLAAKKR